jgi:hypothetical protein
MPSLLERYLSGQYTEVWQELVGLGAAVRDKANYQQARAVGTETMKRARHNVERIITKLEKLGYRFTQAADPPERINFAIAPESPSLQAIREKYSRPDFVAKTEHEKAMVAKIKIAHATRELMTRHSDFFAQIVNKVSGREKRQEATKQEPPALKDPSIFVPASARDAKDLDQVEKKLGGPLPISLRCWYEQVGAVNLMGYHSALNPKDIRESPDPLVIDPFMEAIQAWFGEDLEFEEDGIELPLAPDDISKAFQSGGEPYAIKLPERYADGLLLHERHDTTLVEYLRIVFQWGGFPGWELASKRPDKELDDLREGLLAI